MSVSRAIPAHFDDSASGWERALYAFLAEKERRSGSKGIEVGEGAGALPLGQREPGREDRFARLARLAVSGPLRFVARHPAQSTRKPTQTPVCLSGELAQAWRSCPA